MVLGKLDMWLPVMVLNSTIKQSVKYMKGLKGNLSLNYNIIQKSVAFFNCAVMLLFVKLFIKLNGSYRVSSLLVPVKSGNSVMLLPLRDLRPKTKKQQRTYIVS